MAMTFEEIIAGVSNKQLIANYDDQLIRFGKLAQKNQKSIEETVAETRQKEITPGQQRTYVAWYARALSEHAGFESFSTKNALKQNIETFYNAINRVQSLGDFLNNLEKQTAPLIEDRHFWMGNPFHHEQKQPDYHCGKNLCKEDLRPADYVPYAHEDMTTPDGQKARLWEIGSVNKNGEDVMIISILNMNGPNAHTYQRWEEFIKAFDKLYLENKEKWDKGRIILDVRNNGGREDKPIHHIASRLYGNVINPIESVSINDTPFIRNAVQKAGFCKTVPTSDRANTEEASNENRILLRETFYPFNENTGYQGKIDVLMDKRTASAAESAYSLFYLFKNTRFIGENTNGMQHYRQSRFATPWGGMMSIGVMALKYRHGQMCECIGNEPDVRCENGQNALDVALDTQRIDENRPPYFRNPIKPLQEYAAKQKDLYYTYEPDEKQTAENIHRITKQGHATDVRSSCYGKEIVEALKMTTNTTKTENLYQNFIDSVTKDINVVQDLIDARNWHEERKADTLPRLYETQENDNYNAGTNARIPTDHVVIANTVELRQAFNTYQQKNPTIPDEEAKARVVFDFFGRNGSRYSYENDADKVVFGNQDFSVSRKQFYAGIFDDAMHNTNFWAQNMDVTAITLEPKDSANLPKNTEGLSKNVQEKFQNIPLEERMSIIYKRGLYHEMMHAVTGTTDERKCDAYALLRIMREHPKHARVIFDVYNMARSKTGHTISEMNAQNWDKEISKGTMTYLMPKIYQQLKWFADRPYCIPEKADTNGGMSMGEKPASTDAKLMSLVSDMTKEPDFTNQQLMAFCEMIADKRNLSPQKLATNEIIQACMKQGGFTNIDEYIQNDKALNKFFIKQQEKQKASANAQTKENEGR